MSDDTAAIEELLRESKPGAIHTVLHYLYFPEKEAAAKAALQLRQQDYAVEERLGADGKNWLVLAQHAVVPSEVTITGVRRMMESLASIGAGEYDGWEAEVQS